MFPTLAGEARERRGVLRKASVSARGRAAWRLCGHLFGERFLQALGNPQGEKGQVWKIKRTQRVNQTNGPYKWNAVQILPLPFRASHTAHGNNTHAYAQAL